MTNPTPIRAGTKAGSANTVAESMAASDAFEAMDPDDREMHYLIGWIIASAPVVLLDALNGLDEKRKRQTELNRAAAGLTR